MKSQASPPGPLAGRVAVVTGAARGIGAAVATRLARNGATVVLADRDSDPLEAVASGLRGEGLDAQAQTVDITHEADIAALSARLQRQARLDILVNNAAILDGTPIDALTRARFEEVQAVNQNGALWMTLGLLGLLRRSEHGRVVNIASIIGVRGVADSLAYATAKGGVVNMTRSLAVDLAPDGILVNCICPGFVDTRMALLPDGSGHEHETDWFRDIYIKYGRIPLRRPAQPDEIAAATSFFCGDDCRYVTGQILLVDGGVSATF
ncbi:SDR family oxidoreductase [Mesorhizobium sp. BAC0120]|uniref:SDR family NAD(P)-dependent oxidoreductase n=1 Tax=Mesorhizobium sp. BAC0120 TaxID=3090670 RepID=UPI00298D1D62|nr:SDR family oxidoreductase [Mesorhizobium sp. BAC0120]MDW6023258.1 SDR family oxidoreductase [Mesorhizobium sp. BAC0120]